MNIHEYQAKGLLKQSCCAPVAVGACIFAPEEAEAAAMALSGPVWAVKAQIHAGGRGKGYFLEDGAGAGGGVVLARSAAAAAEAARNMLGKHLVTAQTGAEGKMVRRVYIEQGVGISDELYLSLLVDRSTGQIVLISSNAGGMNIEEVAASTPERIARLVIDIETGLTEAMIAKAGAVLGLSGGAAEQWPELAANLYRLFIDKDMSLLEINPLIVTDSGDLHILDAKLSFDDNALYRHPDIADLRDPDEEDARERDGAKWGLAYIALDGNIGCMVNGAGLAMATMDIIKLHGASPANFCDVGGGASAEKVAAAFRIIMKDPNVRAMLVNIFGGIMRCDTIAEGILAAVKEIGLTVPLVVRLEGTNVDKGKDIISASGLSIITANDLDDAARKVIAAVS